MPQGIAGPVTRGLIRTEFMSAVQQAAGTLHMAKIARRVKIDKENDVIEGIGAPMALVPYTGESKFTDLAKYLVYAASKRYQGGFTYDRNAPNDALWPQIQGKIRELGIAASNHGQKLLSTKVAAGTSGTGYDSVAYYATTHPCGGGNTQSNLLTGTGAASQAHITTDYWRALAAIRGMKTDQGDKIERGPLKCLVQCPPELEEYFQNLAKAQMISSTTNILAGQFDVWADPNLSDAVDWYLHVMSDPAAPFIYAVYADPEVLIQEDGWLVKVDAGVHHDVVYGAYQNSIKVNNT